MSNERHPDFASNDFDNALSEELCTHHGVLLHLNFHQQGSEVHRRLLAVLCRFPSHAESVPRCALSSCQKETCVPSIQALSEYQQSVLELLESDPRNFCDSTQYSILLIAAFVN